MVLAHCHKRVSGQGLRKRKPGENAVDSLNWDDGREKSKTIKSDKVHSNLVIKVGLNKETPRDLHGLEQAFTIV